jgi:hypothetical protein
VELRRRISELMQLTGGGILIGPVFSGRVLAPCFCPHVGGGPSRYAGAQANPGQALEAFTSSIGLQSTQPGTSCAVVTRILVSPGADRRQLADSRRGYLENRKVTRRLQN